MGGRGNSLGGVIVDCKIFDWIESGRYPAKCDIVPQRQLDIPCPV
jgi:O-acetylhomoserine/O-acetylserine sulfhydrylase-like pyridoxal-dependent enzyme